MVATDFKVAWLALQGVVGVLRVVVNGHCVVRKGLPLL
jgi:hypothetical protein